MKRSIRTTTALAAVLVLAVAGGAAGQYGPSYGAAQSAASGVRRESVTLTRGQAFNVDFGRDIRIARAVDPSVADIDVITSRRATIRGTGFGRTTVMFEDDGGPSLVLDVRVEQDLTTLQETFARLLPDARVTPISVGDNIFLQGTAPNAAVAARAVQVAQAFVDSPDNVRNTLVIEGNDQVSLRVQVVEVNRTVVKQLGFNTNFIFGQLGMDQYLLGNTPGYAVNGGYQGGFGGGYSRNTTRQPMIERQVQVPVQVYDPATGTFHTEFETQTLTFVDRDTLVATPQDSAGSTGTNQAQALLQAFERVGMARTLAQPVLTAISGEPGRFLAGGEFAVPTGRDQSGNVQTEFKPYGVGLAFTPVVLSGGRISIKMEVEVSELSSQGAFTVLGTGGDNTSLVIPGLVKRTAQTVVELPSGGSTMIAGLLMESTRQNIDKVPGIADMPIMGALARSRDYLSNESELVIIVTAYLTNPVNPNLLQTPADGLQIASDMETILLGRLNTAYRRPDAAPPAQRYEGPFGHVID